MLLSDYALWANDDLCRAIESSEDGFVPLSTLISISNTVNINHGLDPSFGGQTRLVMALRRSEDAASRYEVRMSMVEPSPSSWDPMKTASWVPERTTRPDIDGGYQIRVRGSTQLLARVREMTPNDWKKRTIYIETLPRGVKSSSRIAEFVSNIVLQHARGSGPLVQSVSFVPPTFVRGVERADPSSTRALSHPDRHHGFAFVILRDEILVDSYLSAWPWRRDSNAVDTDNKDALNDVAEALQVKLRSLSIPKWLELQAEYLDYQKQLLHNTASSTPIQPPSSREYVYTPSDPSDSGLGGTPHVLSSRREANHEPEELSASTSTSTPIPMLSFPSGCLAFVKNVHYATNKTALKHLLSQAFAADEPEDGTSRARRLEIDYIDYQKNMDTCHVRLGRPGLLDRLQAYFISHPTIQQSGLDDPGSINTSGPSARSNAKPIVVDVVSGVREENYWGKLPERVRRDALRKASCVITHDDQRHPNSGEAGGGKRRRQR